MYDVDNPSAALDLHDFIGFAECTLGQIVAAGYSGLSLPLTQKKSRFNPKGPRQPKQTTKGRIILTAEELVQFKEEVKKLLLFLLLTVFFVEFLDSFFYRKQSKERNKN